MLMTSKKWLRQIFSVIETGNLLFLKLLWKNRAQARVLPGKIFRDYMSLVGSEKWASRNIFQILAIPPGTRITLEPMTGHGIDSPVDELAYLALVTQVLQPQRILEIGTFRGRTALNFAINSPTDCRVLTLDLPPENREQMQAATNTADAHIIEQSHSGIDSHHKDVSHKIEQLYGNSLEYDFSPYYGQIDLVFVDGAHHYEAVISDTRQALKMVRPGGAILWHDFANYGDYHDVTRAIIDVLGADRISQISNTQLAIHLVPS